MTPSPPPDNYNPYAAPAGYASSAVTTAGRVPGESIKWIYAALAAASLVSLLAVFVGSVASVEGPITRALGVVAVGPLSWATSITGLCWLYAAWSGVPAEYRGGTTPGRAIGYLFVPFLGIFWWFVVNARLCDSLDAVLVYASDDRRSPKGLAILAPVVALAPMVMLFTPLSHFAFFALALSRGLWFLYMLRCDVVRRAVVEMADRAAQNRASYRF